MNWLQQALTGADNATIAIGRLLGAVIALVLLIALPVAAAVTLICGLVGVGVWRDLFEALGLYVPLVVTAIAGLIWGTAKTEPAAGGGGA
jgi:Na+-transporting NADH:ubiquinone oxidoreductase subunit NqrE